MKDFCITENESSDLLIRLGVALGRAGVNIEGLCLTSSGDSSIIHFAVEDEGATLKTLEEIKIQVSCVSDVFVFQKDQKQVTGKPGSFGEICQTLKENGINIKFGYPAENNRFIFGIDNIEKAKQFLE